MAEKNKILAQNPLILRCNRLMEAFAKSDDERDFYIDTQEGFLVYVDLDKPIEELRALEKELLKTPHRFILIPKMTFYETKKIMEGFVNEKVYDIDTKEKLLDIIQSKDARDNFLEFIFDHHNELEKWQTFYQERSRIRIIEWLRVNHFQFVFEEDLDLPRLLVEKVKQSLFDPKAGKDIVAARKTLETKSKTYYSTEALNPRPKRGRPPKQAVKLEIEPQISADIYTTVPSAVRPFLFTPDISGITAATFSSKFESEEALLANRNKHVESTLSLESINQKLASLRNLASKWSDEEPVKTKTKKQRSYEEDFEEEQSFAFGDFSDESEEEEEEEDFEEEDDELPPARTLGKKQPARKASSETPLKKAPLKKPMKAPVPAPKPAAKRAAPPPKKAAKPVAKKTAAKKATPAPPKGKFRPMKKLKVRQR